MCWVDDAWGGPRAEAMRLRTRAIVLRRVPWGDSSWIAHVLSEEQGALGLIARGARRAGSPFAGRLEPLTLNEYVVSWKDGRDLQSLVQAELLDGRENLGRDLARNAEAHACLEVADRFARHEGEGATLFPLLEEALTRLDRGISFQGSLAAFLARLCEDQGWALAVSHCAQCGADDIPEIPVLTAAAGGFLCRACGMASHQRPLSLRLARALRGEELPDLEATEARALEQVWYEHLFRQTQTRPHLPARAWLAEATA